MKRIMAVCAIILCIPALCQSEGFDIKYNFQSGEEIKAQDFNDNFKAIVDKINELEREAQEFNKKMEMEVINRSGTEIALMVPIGTIMAYGGDIEISENKKRLEEHGWLPCDGAKKLVRDYKNLHDVIGNAFGGDGNYFYLPDMQGRFLRGVDQDANRDPDKGMRMSSEKGGNAGNKVGSVQEDQIKKHQHKLSKTIYVHSRSFKGSDDPDKPLKDRGPFYMDSTQGTGGEETRPKNIYVNFIIKAKDITLNQQ